MELRRLRLERKLSTEEVASYAEWSTSKLVRIENGQVSISKQDLTELLRFYDVQDQQYTQELHQLARTSRQRMWWSQYQKYLSATFLEFIGSEFDATRIQYFQPLVVPGILQTEEYARAVNEATVLTETSVELAQARIEVRLRRQRELIQGRNAPQIITTIDEAALRRLVGGRETMRVQLDHIVTLAKRKAVTLVILPFSSGPHLGMGGPFTLFEYQEERDDDVVFLDNAAGGLILRDQSEIVERYRQEFARMADTGLNGKEAVNFVRRLCEELFTEV